QPNLSFASGTTGPRMAGQFKKLSRILGPREKRNAAILLLMMLVGACLEVLGVAAVPAFVGAVVEPDRLRQLPYLGELIESLALETTTDFVLWGGIALAAVFAAKTAFLVA